jgi:hypothetical protein
MQEMDFYELPRAVQDRFTISVRGEGQPRPLLVIRPGVSRAVLTWSAIGAVAAAMLAGLVGIGLGNLKSNLAVHPLSFVGGYALLTATMAIAGLLVLSSLRQKWLLPYRPGVYLFPAGVVDARDHKLKVFPLSRLVTPLVEDRSLALSFPEGRAFSFPLAISGHTAEVEQTIDDAQAALEKALAAGDKKALGVLDPLIDIGVVNPFAPTGRLQKNTPFWARLGWLVGATIGIVLAPGIWFLRNSWSDRQMLAHASKTRDAASYREYLARGGRNGEVKEVLLPRAELSEAAKDGTVEGIEKFIATHPNSHIQGEVSGALRQAMLGELDTAKKAGTVSALADFAKRHPNNLVDVELRQAIHGVYQAALTKYKKESGIRDANIFAFVDRLLAFAEKNGPKAEMRFRRKATKSMEIADTQIKKSPFFMGTVSLPSQYFDNTRARVRESVAAKTIAARFATAFPPDILSLELGPPVLEADGPLPSNKVPTIFVEHSAEMSGASYLSANPRGVFVGLGMLFDVTFRIPDESKPQRWRLSAWRPPDTTVPKGDSSFESAVYDAMASDGFSQFATRYLSTFFAKSDAKGTN